MVKKKVLVVEDSIFIAKAIKQLLESEGITANTTSDGAKVVDLVKEGKYDLVVLDLMMPDFSGKDVFYMLKADLNTNDVPVLILTAKVDALKEDKELRDCDKFMHKPFDNDELIEVIKGLLQRDSA